MQLKKVKWLATLAAVLATALVPVGCRRTPPLATSPTRVHQDVVLRVACPDDLPARIVELYGKAWGRREGATVEVERYPPGGSPPAEADVWVIAPAELGRWADAGKLRPVPDSYLAENAPYGWKTSLLPIYRDRLLRWDGKPYAMPLLGEAPLCFYRTDHFRSLEQEQKRKFGPPATWEEFAEAAELLSQMSGGKPVLPPLPNSDEELDRLFYTVAVCYARQAVFADDPQQPPDNETFSFHYDLETGQARINTPGFVHALKVLQRLQKVREPGTSPAPPEAFARGRASLCLADASWIERFQQGEARDRFAVCRVPGAAHYFSYTTGEPRPSPAGNRVPYLGAAGWLMVVPAKSAHAEAAFALLADLSGREGSRQIVFNPAWGGGAFRHDHLSAAAWNVFGLQGAPTRDLVQVVSQTLLHPGLRNPLTRLRTPDEREHLRALVAEVRPALLEGRDAAEAMAAVARRWQALDESKDLKQRRAEYFLNVGLEPER
ncbi:MAG TPA: extracellular solute-binding protein [Gemmataceae bacterium]|nr:extracellular solute-binding protein [Gemmataceae bacterium]